MPTAAQSRLMDLPAVELLSSMHSSEARCGIDAVASALSLSWHREVSFAHPKAEDEFSATALARGRNFRGNVICFMILLFSYNLGPLKITVLC